MLLVGVRTRMVVLLCMWLCALVVASHAQATVIKGELISSVLIMRHAERTPVRVFNASRSAWPEGLGHLSSTGMHAAYEFGRRLRALLVAKEHVLPEVWDNNALYVRSTSR